MSFHLYQSGDIVLGEQFLAEDTAHHLFVLRARVGDQLRLFNGAGGEYAATISHIEKKKIRVNVTQFFPLEVESPLKICLAQALAKGDKMDFILQKAVELGVQQFVPVFTERCNVHLDTTRMAKRVAHWQSIIISACEQSGRNHVPTVTAPRSLEKWLVEVQDEQGLILMPTAENRLNQLKLNIQQKINILIGPEGGLSEAELNQALKVNFIPINLGPRILRTETAGLAIISALQVLYGDFC